MAARRKFDTAIRSHFQLKKTQLGLGHLGLSFNQRMIAQRGRGAATAHAVIPREVDQILLFIKEARSNRAALLEDLSTNYRTLNTLARDDIAQALGQLASTKLIHLDYWGYFSSEKMPEFDLNKNKLSYYHHWNEAESTYVIYHNRQMRSNIIRGIIAAMNYVPWYRRVL